MESKVLPINETPSVVSYAHYAFLHSILETDDKVGRKLVELEIDDYMEGKWELLTDKLEIENTNSTIRMFSKKYETNTECFLTRDCKKEDEIVVKITYQQYSNPDCVVNVILSAGNIRECAERDSFIIRAGIMSKQGIYIKVDEQYISLKNTISCEHLPVWIKVKKKAEKIEIWFAEEENEWKLGAEIVSPSVLQKDDLQIGVNTNNGENQYYAWKYLNYLQMYYNGDDLYVLLDYYNSPKRDFCFYHLNQFIQFQSSTYREINSFPGGICDYVSWCLQNDMYVILWLDEYYLSSRPAYGKKHYLHCNMCYGVDQVNKTFYIAGYNVKFKVSLVTFSAFVKSYESANKINCKNEIRLLKYNPNAHGMVCSIEVLRESLWEYLNSFDSSKKYNNVLGTPKFVYGNHVFDAILNDEIGKRKLVKDVKLAFFLQEHSEIMKERINYLYVRGYLSQEQNSFLSEQCNCLNKLCQQLRNLVLKNRYKKTCQEKIYVLFSQIGREEYKMYHMLYDALE